jgi:hypothetical protein
MTPVEWLVGSGSGCRRQGRDPVDPRHLKLFYLKKVPNIVTVSVDEFVIKVPI